MCQLIFNLKKHWTRSSLNKVKFECMNEFQFGVRLYKGSGITPVSDPIHTTGVDA